MKRAQGTAEPSGVQGKPLMSVTQESCSTGLCDAEGDAYFPMIKAQLQENICQNYSSLPGNLAIGFTPLQAFCVSEFKKNDQFLIFVCS